jgi:hypothetical protein
VNHFLTSQRAVSSGGFIAILAVTLAVVTPAPRPSGDQALRVPPSAAPSVAPTPCPSEPPSVAPVAPSAGPSVAPWPPHPLTPRLLQLADPAIAGLPPAERAERLGLRVDGPDSLVVRPCGRILVDIGLSDASPATLDKLRATGARLEVVNAAADQVRAAVAPSQLTALAAIPEVLYVGEVVTPPPGRCITELGVCIW